MSAAEELHNRGVKIEELRARNAELVAALKRSREAIGIRRTGSAGHHQNRPRRRRAYEMIPDYD